jgi:hypothetical protein
MLHWKKESDKLVATTEFGSYEISVSKTRRTDPVEVCLKPIRGGAEFSGQHLTIGQATEAAVADYAYRTHVWESL